MANIVEQNEQKFVFRAEFSWIICDFKDKFATTTNEEKSCTFISPVFVTSWNEELRIQMDIFPRRHEYEAAIQLVQVKQEQYSPEIKFFLKMIKPLLDMCSDVKRGQCINVEHLPLGLSKEEVGKFKVLFLVESCALKIFETEESNISVTFNSIQPQFNYFMEKRMFSDFTICVDKQELQVHKILLASASPVFKAMFDHDVMENQMGRMQITDFSANTVQNLLQFLYTRKKPNTTDIDSALTLFLMCRKYQIETLKKLCANDVISKLLITSEDLTEQLCLMIDVILKIGATIVQDHEESEMPKRKRCSFRKNKTSEENTDATVGEVDATVEKVDATVEETQIAKASD